MEFRKRNNLRHPYCLYLTKEEAEKLAEGNKSMSVVWDARMKLIRHFEKEANGLPPVPDRTDS